MEHIHNYFENKDHWESQKYLGNDNENLRINRTKDLIPTDVNTIIDVGCGNGFFLKTLEDLKLYKLFGIEPSINAINQNLSSLKLDKGTIDDIKFDDDFFDLVTCLEVIEHLPFKTYEKGLLELERISKKYIIISVPHQETRNHVVCPYCDCHFNGTTHLKSFDDNKLVNLFKGSKLISLLKVGKTKKFKYQSLRKLFKRNI
ncbi:class I SAM-dependent methyltransferase, partial [Flavobacteriaceae bacterium]|nr:class I SAM-dependent methyltransferase [Flavobacteriaceae bacterium]